MAHSILVSAWHMMTNDEPYQIAALTGSRAAKTRPTPGGWSRSSNGSDTPCSSTPSPESHRSQNVVSGSARRAHAPAPVQVIHGSVWHLVCREIWGDAEGRGGRLVRSIRIGW